LTWLFDSVDIVDNVFQIKFTSENITGQKMVRRSEFGDVYMLIINTKTSNKNFLIQMMVAKNDGNGTDLFNIIQAITRKWIKSRHSKDAQLTAFVINLQPETEEYQFDLKFDDITFSFNGDADKLQDYQFLYSRPLRTEEEIADWQKMVEKLANAFVNVRVVEKKLIIWFTAKDIVGTKMARRSEFGDVYILRVKTPKMENECLINMMIAKKDPNGTELFQIIQAITKKWIQSDEPKSVQLTNFAFIIKQNW